MKPFLRRSNLAEFAPVGWVSEPAGMWAGRQVEVVFDRRRHVIVMVRRDPGDAIRALLTAAGFQPLDTDGRQEMWMGDRTRTGRANGEQAASRAQPQRDAS